MAVTITAVTLNQGVAGGTVAVSAKITDTYNRSVNVSYMYKLHTSDTWLAATTTLPATVAATSAGTTVNGTWAVNDDVNTAIAAGAFDFEIIVDAPNDGTHAEELVNYTGAVTATTVGPAITIPTDAPNTLPLEGDALGVQPEDLEVLSLEGHVDKYGAVAQGNLNWSFAKKTLNELVTGERWVIQIFRDRNDPAPRAILLTPAIYNKLVGANDQNIVEKDVPWFINCAHRNLTDVFRNDTAFRIVDRAVVSTGYHKKAVQKTEVAYLISYADFVKYSA